MTMLKTISLWNPWATLMAAGYKRIETRSWQPRGLRPGQLVAIHAAKHWTEGERELIAYDPFFKRYLTLAERRGLWSFKTPQIWLGGVVAIARFQGACPVERLWDGLTQREHAFGNFAPHQGRNGWLFNEVRPVAIIPAQGKQGLFEWDAPQEIANLYLEPVNRMKDSEMQALLPTPTREAPAEAQAAMAATPGASTTVVHVNRDPFDVYVGRQVRYRPDLRPLGWGNPYADGLDTPEGRLSVIDRFRAWILDQPRLLARLPELRGKRLGCWCAPLGGLTGDFYGHTCHGEVLAALADRWCAQCNRVESPEHVREHEAAAETFMGQVLGTLTSSGHFREVK